MAKAKQNTTAIAKPDNTKRVPPITDKDRERIREHLLTEHMSYGKTARELGYTFEQVRGVAVTIRPELDEQSKAEREEIARLLQCGTRSALEKLIDAVENDQIPPDKLPTAAGVLYDKWRDLAGSTSMIQALVVPGGTDASGVASQIIGVLMRAQTHVGQINGTDAEG